MFHGIGPGRPIEDWRQLPSSRYFLLAERLVHYQGACRALLLTEQQPTTASAPVGTSVAAGTSDDIAAVAAMSQNSSGFPGVGFSGG